jgi:5'-nucleotidase
MKNILRLILASTTMVASLTLSSAGARPAAPTTVKIQLLAINDFHGNLEPPAGSSGRIGTVTAGGAEYLATHIRRLEATNPHTVVVSAGDLVGASPLLSALFHDEPTIEAMNEIGLDINAVGNHEFDEGADELLRMEAGGCHPVDGCQDGDGFAGSEFKFLAANVTQKRNGKPLFPPYQIRAFAGGVKVAFIGMTLEGTPQIVTPSGISHLQFHDEADTVNALIPELRAKGVEAIIVLLHEGGATTGGINECPGISGPIVDIAHRMDDEVDAIISGHTHLAYNCVIDGKPVTSASSFGRLVTDIDVTIDVATGDVSGIAVNNVIASRDVERYAPITSLIQRYGALAAPLAGRVIGSISADMTRAPTAAGESSLGDVIADAQLFATRPAGLGGAAVAFMNPGGIRADLLYAPAKGEAPGEVTYEEAFTVQPFGNSLVTMSLTGEQIDTLLEQQWLGQSSPRILQVSRGFAYTWDAAAPVGGRVDPSTITLNGVTVDPAASYRVTVNSFLAEGGDGFTVLRQGTDRLGGDVDLDALEKYMQAESPVAPGPRDRILRIN